MHILIRTYLLFIAFISCDSSKELKSMLKHNISNDLIAYYKMEDGKSFIQVTTLTSNTSLFTLEIEDALNSNPPLIDEVDSNTNVFFISDYNTLSCLDLKTKKIIWSISPERSVINKFIDFDKDRILVSLENSDLLIVHKIGGVISRKIESTATEVEINSPSQMLSDKHFLYLLNWDNSDLIVLDILTEKVLWKKKLKELFTPFSIMQLTENYIFIGFNDPGSNDAYIELINKNNGDLILHQDIHYQLWSKPIIIENEIFFIVNHDLASYTVSSINKLNLENKITTELTRLETSFIPSSQDLIHLKNSDVFYFCDNEFKKYEYNFRTDLLKNNGSCDHWIIGLVKTESDSVLEITR